MNSYDFSINKSFLTNLFLSPNDGWIESCGNNRMVFYFAAATVNKTIEMFYLREMLEAVNEIRLSVYYDDYIKCEVKYSVEG